MKAFLEFVTNIGKWFFFLLLALLIFYALLFFIVRVKHLDRSSIDPAGPVIVFLLFVMPCCSIASYWGSLIDQKLSQSNVFTIFLLVIGFITGVWLWWKARQF